MKAAAAVVTVRLPPLRCVAEPVVMVAVVVVVMVLLVVCCLGHLLTAAQIGRCAEPSKPHEREPKAPLRF